MDIYLSDNCLPKFPIFVFKCVCVNIYLYNYIYVHKQQMCNLFSWSFFVLQLKMKNSWYFRGTLLFRFGVTSVQIIPVTFFSPKYIFAYYFSTFYFFALCHKVNGFLFSSVIKIVCDSVTTTSYLFIVPVNWAYLASGLWPAALSPHWSWYPPMWCHVMCDVPYKLWTFREDKI